MRHVFCLTALIGWAAAFGASPAGAAADGEPSPGVTTTARVPAPSTTARVPVPSKPPGGPVASPARTGGAAVNRALVLAISQGPVISPTNRVVVLQCAPLGGGTHPRTRNACASLLPVNGDVGKFKPSTKTFCPLIYDPVTMSAVGVWDGRFALSSQTFSNSCLLRATLGEIAGF
ncbi:SSI family serine proteinase inhibitor [Streptosporangium sp. NPDC023615]|uniref:SSI family serine proteinase inhibitor n=1 Tax=Streptosporangium sp. NPDC023615 TaxID=3154794 RepID=UPI003444FF15